MSSNNNTSSGIQIFTGSNWTSFWLFMAPYLQPTGHTWVMSVSTPPVIVPTSTKKEREFWIQWTKANNTILGSIKIHLSEPLKAKHTSLVATVADLVKTLKDEYNAPGIMGAYKLFKDLLATEIPSWSHPAPALNKIETLFTCLKDTSEIKVN